MSEAYTPDNLLDRLSDPATLAEQYERGKRRERELLDRHLGLAGGDAISIGCGWHPGRHLLPAPQWRLVAVGHRRRPHARRRRAGRRGRGRRRRGRRARRARGRLVRRRAAPARPAPRRLRRPARAVPARGAPAAAARRRARRDRAEPLPPGRRRARARQPRRARRQGPRHARRHPAVAAAPRRRRARGRPAAAAARGELLVAAAAAARAARRRRARPLRLGARPALGRAHVHAHRAAARVSGVYEPTGEPVWPCHVTFQRRPGAPRRRATRSSRTRSSSPCAAAGSATSPGSAYGDRYAVGHAGVAGRTRPQIDAFEPTRRTASGRRNAGSDGFGLPSAKRSPDSKPPYWPGPGRARVGVAQQVLRERGDARVVEGDPLGDRAVLDLLGERDAARRVGRRLDAELRQVDRQPASSARRRRGRGRAPSSGGRARRS